MELQLSYNRSENNAISKTLSNIVSITGTLRGDADVLNPAILLEGADFSAYNYAYIPLFNRYYFIDGCTSYRNGLWIMRLTVDVLMSFRDDILDTSAILLESEETGIDPYLPDSRVWVSRVKDKTDILTFPNGLLENGELILITAGG